mmetsp:Transcript_15358/g.30836  ORF Transcript_15358/g.30836 Transcript_15358/m.30836 type:complete len:200 (-) Transcript_15358:645-1244(-)
MRPQPSRSCCASASSQWSTRTTPWLSLSCDLATMTHSPPWSPSSSVRRTCSWRPTWTRCTHPILTPRPNPASHLPPRSVRCTTWWRRLRRWRPRQEVVDLARSGAPVASRRSSRRHSSLRLLALRPSFSPHSSPSTSPSCSEDRATSARRCSLLCALFPAASSGSWRCLCAAPSRSMRARHGPSEWARPSLRLASKRPE